MGSRGLPIQTSLYLYKTMGAGPPTPCCSDSSVISLKPDPSKTGNAGSKEVRSLRGRICRLLTLWFSKISLPRNSPRLTKHMSFYERSFSPRETKPKVPLTLIRTQTSNGHAISQSQFLFKPLCAHASAFIWGRSSVSFSNLSVLVWTVKLLPKKRG